jgi:hypothetical protein
MPCAEPVRCPLQWPAREFCSPRSSNNDAGANRHFRLFLAGYNIQNSRSRLPATPPAVKAKERLAVTWKSGASAPRKAYFEN